MRCVKEVRRAIRFAVFAAVAVLLLCPLAPSRGFADGAPVAQESRTVVLQYSEPASSSGNRKPRQMPPRRGGIVPALERVAEMISKSGSEGGSCGPGAVDMALLGISVVPVLHEQDGAAEVTLNFPEEPQWFLDPEMKPGSAKGCIADRARVLDRLKEWSVKLTQAQMEELKSKGVVTLPVTEPFSDNQFLSKPDLKVDVRTKAASARKWHVASVKIDYSPWEAGKRKKESSVRVIEDEVRRHVEESKKALEAWEQRRKEAEEAKAELEKARAAEAEAERAVVEFQPTEAKKTDAYRRKESELKTAWNAAETCWKLIEDNRAMGVAPVQGQAERLAGLEKKMDELAADLAAMERSLGIDEDREACRKAAKDAFLARYKAADAYAMATSSLETARNAVNEAADRVISAKVELDAAQEALDKLRAKGEPLVTGIWLYDPSRKQYYVGTWWDPSEALDFLDKEIGRLDEIRRVTAEDRAFARVEFMKAQGEALKALDNLWKGIWESFGAQCTIETCFNLYEVAKSTAEGGIIGGLAEGAKKCVEAWAFGEPTLYEPSVADSISETLMLDAEGEIHNLAKTAKKRGKQSLTTGPGAKLVIAYYLKTRDFRKYLEAIGKAVVDVSTDPRVKVHQIVDAKDAASAVSLFDQYEKSKEGIQKAWKDALFHDVARARSDGAWATVKSAFKSTAAKKFAEGYVRDVWKRNLKIAAGEWLEGTPLRDYMDLEFKARSASLRLMAASTVYWQAVDELEARRAERAEILRQYDPQNQLQVQKNEEFAEGTTIDIELTDRDGHPMKPDGRTISVTLGCRKVPRVQADYLKHEIVAKDLQDDGKGGVTLSITVTEGP